MSSAMQIAQTPLTAAQIQDAIDASIRANQAVATTQDALQKALSAQAAADAAAAQASAAVTAAEKASQDAKTRLDAALAAADQASQAGATATAAANAAAVAQAQAQAASSAAAAADARAASAQAQAAAAAAAADTATQQANLVAVQASAANAAALLAQTTANSANAAAVAAASQANTANAAAIDAANQANAALSVANSAVAQAAAANTKAQIALDIAPFNVKAYGAIGDSNPGNASANAAAINAAIFAAASKGGVVAIPPGTYYVNSPINLVQNVTLKGSGAQATIIKLASGSNCNLVQANFNSPGADYIYVEDMLLDGNRSNQTSGNGIVFTQVHAPSYIKSVTIVNCKDAGIKISAGSVIQLENVWSNLSANALVADSVVSLMVTDSTFEHSDGTGIILTNTQDVYRIQNNFKGCHIEGIGTSGSQDGFSIAGGPDYFATTSVSLEGCEFRGTSGFERNCVDIRDSRVACVVTGLAQTGWKKAIALEFTPTINVDTPASSIQSVPFWNINASDGDSWFNGSINGYRVMKGTGIPTAGTYAAGDTIMNVAPTPGAPIGWVCITGGYPGTWQPLGTLPGSRVATSSPVTASLTDDVIMTNLTTPAAVTVNLPVPTAASAGKRIVIKDARGDAATNNVSVKPPAGRTLDGGTGTTITTNYGSLTCMTDGTNWFILL